MGNPGDPIEEVTGFIEETKVLESELHAAVEHLPQAKGVKLLFHSDYRTAVGEVPSEEQEVMIQWCNRLADRNHKMKAHFTLHGQEHILKLLPLVGFGSQVHFGYHIDSFQAGAMLSRELDVLERELAREKEQQYKPEVSPGTGSAEESRWLSLKNTAVIIGTLATLIWGVYQIRPVLRVKAQGPVEPGNPYKWRFVITNKGELPARVTASCFIREVEFEKGYQARLSRI